MRFSADNRALAELRAFHRGLSVIFFNRPIYLVFSITVSTVTPRNWDAPGPPLETNIIFAPSSPSLFVPVGRFYSLADCLLDFYEIEITYLYYLLCEMKSQCSVRILRVRGRAAVTANTEGALLWRYTFYEEQGKCRREEKLFFEN